MNIFKQLCSRYAGKLIAAAVILVLFSVARIPEVDAAGRAALTSRFAFSRMDMPAIPGAAMKRVLEVHPSLARFATWISAVAASAAFGDLDNDGLPNDLCFVESRTGQVLLSPAPGTPARYPATVLDAGSLVDAKTMSATGCRLADLNEDGWTDVVVYFFGRTPIAFLRRNDGAAPVPQAGAFVPQVIGPKDERWYTTTATLADLDGDGRIDLLFGNYFQDGARMLDPKGPDREQMQDSMSQAFNGGHKRIFLTVGGTTGANPSVELREAEGALEEETSRQWTLAAGAADLDGDLLPEVYLANDFGPDALLHNESTPGHLKFTRLYGQRHLGTPKSKVLGHDSFKGMGIDFGDINGDGQLDMFVSNLTATYALMEGHFAWVSTGKPELMRQGIAPYEDRSEELGLSRSGWGWETRFADMDNDGVLEAMQAVGFAQGTINRWPELQEFGMGHEALIKNTRMWPQILPGDDVSGQDHNPFYVRGSDGRYHDIAKDLGIGNPVSSRGIALADVDGDGDLDFVYANQWMPSYFYRNDCPKPGAFLGIHPLLSERGAGGGTLRERPGHPSAELHGRQAITVSATVRLPGGGLLVRQLDSGNGHSGARSPDLHFGLGAIPPGTKLDVELRWRDESGHLQQQELKLEPGWHTVLLGTPLQTAKGTDE